MAILIETRIPFPTQAASATGDEHAALTFAGRLLAAYWAPETAAAADGTNNAAITLETSDGAGGSWSTVGALDTVSVGMVLGTSREMTLSGGGREVPTGGQLRLTKSVNNTGAVIHGVLSVLVEKPAS
jgi:hypothetical protein